jgi:hypothetical protein
MSLEETPELPEKPGLFGYAQYVWYYAVREGSVIRKAPGSFIIAMLVVGFPIYWLLSEHIRDQYTEQIDDLRASKEKLDGANKMLQATIEFQDRKIAGGIGSQQAATIGPSRIQFIGAERLPPLFPVRINMHYVNRGSIPAVGTKFAGNSKFVQKPLTNVEIDSLFDALSLQLKSASNNNSTSEIQPSDPIFNTIQSTSITQDQINMASVPDSKEILYSYAIQRYRDDNTPLGKWRITEVCLLAMYGSADQVCDTHNGIFISD